MPILVVQLGSQRIPGEGPRLGTVRRPPRGVRKEDFSTLNYFDVWLPELAPTATLATLSRQTNFSVGCYCDDSDRCHRSLLARLLRDAGADVTLQKPEPAL